MNDQHNDERLTRMFDELDFGPEPPTPDSVAEIAARGRRALRRRRAASWTAGTVAVAAAATGVAFALPNSLADDGELGLASPGLPSPVPTEQPESEVADSDDAVEPDPAPEPEPESSAEHTDPAEPFDLPFPATRELLVAAAVRHLDPDGEHLEIESTNAQTAVHLGGAASAGTKLGWTVAGETGTGMVQVAVTTPGYASAEDFAVEGFASSLGCDIGLNCTEQPIPGGDATAWVAGPDEASGRLLTVVHQREDGSLVGIAVSDLFGNNSIEPVSHVDIDLEQAFAFVADAGLHIDADEAADPEGQLFAEDVEDWAPAGQ